MRRASVSAFVANDKKPRRGRPRKKPKKVWWILVSRRVSRVGRDGHRVERLGERREVLHPYRWSAVRHRGRRVHRGHDVQQVRDVAAVAPSEELLGCPRHRALGVVAVVDRDEDDARRGGRDAVDGRRGARRTAGMVPEIDGGHAARAEGRRACGGVALLGSSVPTNSPSPARSLPPASTRRPVSFSAFSPNSFRGTKISSVGAAVDKARAACAEDTAIESHA